MKDRLPGNGLELWWIIRTIRKIGLSSDVYYVIVCDVMWREWIDRRTVYRSLVNYSRLFDVYLSVSTTSAPELNGQQKK